MRSRHSPVAGPGLHVAGRIPPGVSRARGFTLVELIVVLVVLTCAAGLIVPRMSNSLSRQELRETAQRLALTARSVREVAIAQQQSMEMQIDLDHGGFSVSRRGNAGTSELVRKSWMRPQRWPETVKAVEVRLPDGTQATSGMRGVTFDPDGSSSGASIRLASGEREYMVVIRPGSGQATAGDPQTMAVPQDQYDQGD